MSSYQFEADTGKILDIVIHSLYSNKRDFFSQDLSLIALMRLINYAIWPSQIKNYLI